MNPINITVKYFALLREKAGISEEQITTEARTPEALYKTLEDKYHFHMKMEGLRVAINQEFSHWQDSLKEGDELVFMTPVAGG